MARVAAGDRESLRPLHARYAALLFGIAARNLDAAAAEEIVQDAFVQVWRKASTFDPAIGRFRPWLLRIVHARVANEFRTRSRRPASEGADPDALVDDANVAPDEAAWLAFRHETMRRAVSALPPAQQQALRLAYFDELTQSEIADFLSVPLGTAKSRIRSALRALQLTLGPLLAIAIIALVAVTAMRAWRDERALDMVTSSDLVTRRLGASAGVPSETHGNFRQRPGGGTAILTLSNLPALPAGSRYQAWIRHGERWESMGAVAPDAPLLVIEGPTVAIPPDALLVTRESSAGGPTQANAIAAWP